MIRYNNERFLQQFIIQFHCLNICSFTEFEFCENENGSYVKKVIQKIFNAEIV